MELLDDVTTLKRVGKKKAAALNKLDIFQIQDLLFFYPRSYEDRRQITPISELTDGQTALICARAALIVKGRGFGRRQTLRILAEDDSGSAEILFFNSSYLDRAFQRGESYAFYGKISIKNGKIQLLHPDFRKWAENEARILPVYPLVHGISQSDLRGWIAEALSQSALLNEYLPEETRKRNNICGLQYALQNIHFPEDPRKIQEARFRFVFEELLLLQTGLLYIRNQLKHGEKGTMFSAEVKSKEFTDMLPYPLTGAQKKVIGQIETDMESNAVMNRLVQGDVGSGKTAVAAAALYKAVKSGYQGVLMAPTEILARQHVSSLTEQFSPFGIKVGFLSGSLSTAEKKEILSSLAAGEIDILVGTHAVIREGVVFHKLGLVITDEQHRFGVEQRDALAKKGDNPDILVMTATPIPRTLAMTLYGDLDISVIDELPPGRQPIATKALGARGREKSYKFLQSQILEGRQAYVVAPLIEDSEEIGAKSASKLFSELCQRFPHQNIALLHGAMKQKEKDSVMEQFYRGEISILVSTVVIEVGINVPNATVMLIENAERFGLAQLHQLRGRVGRGRDQSYCILITEGKTEVSKQRAKIMEETNDGFVIAEKDLQLRGPGEIFGMRQHGVPELRIADPVRHVKVLEKVKEETKQILEEDPTLKLKKNELLKKKIRYLFRGAETLKI